MGKTEGPAAGAGLESCRAPWADRDKGSDTGGLVPGSCATGNAGGRGGDGAEARNARSSVLSGPAAGTLAAGRFTVSRAWMGALRQGIRTPNPQRRAAGTVIPTPSQRGGAAQSA